MKLVLVVANMEAGSEHYCSFLYADDGDRNGGCLLIHRLEAFITSIKTALNLNSINAIQFGEEVEGVIGYICKPIPSEKRERIMQLLEHEGVNLSLVESQ